MPIEYKPGDKVPPPSIDTFPNDITGALSRLYDSLRRIIKTEEPKVKDDDDPTVLKEQVVLQDEIEDSE